MRKEFKCTCPLCREGSYDSADYYVDMSFLKKEHPVGVSGLLRVKNDAEFLSDCIDSCIDALDELVICYQDCTDNATEIIRKKQRQYPDKIKIYYYAPPVFCHGLTEEEKKYAFSLSDSSVHKLCNYYNYTLSKATYRYAMKIDSDQVYFSDKLRLFCDAYRSENKVRMSVSDYFIKYYTERYRGIMSRYTFLYPWDILSRIPEIAIWINKKYQKYLIKEIINHKYALSLSGINLGYEQGKWRMCLLNKLVFNGATDHLIFPLNEENFYTTYIGRKRPIEVMRYQKRILYGGWFWYHLKGMRKNTDENPEEWLSLAQLMDRKPDRRFYTGWPLFFKNIWLFSWAYEKDLPDPDQILTETRSNLCNRKS